MARADHRKSPTTTLKSDRGNEPTARISTHAAKVATRTATQGDVRNGRCGMAGNHLTGGSHLLGPVSTTESLIASWQVRSSNVDGYLPVNGDAWLPILLANRAGSRTNSNHQRGCHRRKTIIYAVAKNIQAARLVPLRACAWRRAPGSLFQDDRLSCDQDKGWMIT